MLLRAGVSVNLMRIACCQELSESFIETLKVLGELLLQELNGGQPLCRPCNQ